MGWLSGKILVNVVRTLRLESSIPSIFWADTLSKVVHIINHFLSPKLYNIFSIFVFMLIILYRSSLDL